MFDHALGPYHHHPCLCPDCVPLRAFAQDHRDALLYAAALLGGRSGMARAQAVLDGVADPSISTSTLRRRLSDLLDLLTLEHVHDDTQPEAALFAAIDPWDPVVEDICMLADGLRHAIDAWNAARAHTDAVDAGRKAA